MNWPSHGSNPRYLYEAMNLALPDKLIDFSANINPLGPPGTLHGLWSEFFDSITDYPDPEASSLKEVLAEKEQISRDDILIGNGGAELITLVGRMLAGKKVLLVQPTFSEYEQACRMNNCHVFYYHLEENWGLNIEALVEELVKVDAVFLCHPNNPTGVCFPYEAIQRLVEACEETGTYLIIDEAFHDFWKHYQSLTPMLQHAQRLILLRSMTKMYSIPGLRLGYVMANKRIIEQLAKYQPHWSINGIALLAGEECLRNEIHVNQTIDYIEKEREKLFSFFKEEGFEVSPSEVNFYLIRDQQIESQYSLFEFLLRQGIVPRHTMNFPRLEGKWLRFAIKSTKENDHLLEALRTWRS